jgi:hypothetical protein
MAKIKAETKAAEKRPETTITKEDREMKKVEEKKEAAEVVETPKKKKAAKVVEAPKVEAKKDKPKSCITIMKELLAKKATDKKITETFTAIYNAKGQMDAEFIARRIVIYKKIAGEKEA